MKLEIMAAAAMALIATNPHALVAEKSNARPAIETIGDEYAQSENSEDSDWNARLSPEDRKVANTVELYRDDYVGKIPECNGMGMGHDAHGHPIIRIEVNPLTDKTRRLFPHYIDGIPVILEEGGTPHD
jgi:hypothetical protein